MPITGYIGNNMGANVLFNALGMAPVGQLFVPFSFDTLTFSCLRTSTSLTSNL